MISGSLIFLILLVLTIFNWQASLKAKELALSVAKQLCQQNQVNLLDDTVILRKLSFKNFKLIRQYRFDYHTGSNVRYQGYISISQNEVTDQRLSIYAENLDKADLFDKPAKVLDFSQYKNLKSKNDV